MLLREGIDGLLGTLDLAERDIDPHILKNIRDLTEHPINGLKAAGEKMMNSVLHRVLVSHVENVDRVSKLADPLDTSLALFEACGVPRKV
jgi:hypothetical protein